MAIHLAADRRDHLTRSLQGFFMEEFDLQTRLDDLEGEVYAREVF